jgi:CBS domain-containing protein
MEGAFGAGRAGAGLTASDLMHEGCVCAKANQTIADAARTMAIECIGAMPICGENDKLVGMLTDRDIVVKCVGAGLDPNQCTVGDLADGIVVWVKADAPVNAVLATMEEHQVRRLPVINDKGRLCGIVSQGDVARHLGQEAAGELLGAVSQGAPMQHAG